MFILVLGAMVIFAGCANDPGVSEEVGSGFYWSHGELLDGDYRGAYVHAAENVVVVQITIEDGVVVDTSFRDMTYSDIRWDPDGSEMADGSEIPEDNQWMVLAGKEGIDELAEQHDQVLLYLEGAEGLEGLEEIRERTKEMEGNPGEDTGLYKFIEPKEVEGAEIDTFTAATIRSDKVGSAIRDAINRGRYR